MFVCFDITIKNRTLKRVVLIRDLKTRSELPQKPNKQITKL